MLPTHYYLIQNHSVTKRASLNLYLGLSFQPLSWCQLWYICDFTASSKVLFLSVLVLSPKNDLHLLHYHANATAVPVVEGNCRSHPSTAAEIHIILSHLVSHTFPQLYKLLQDEPWSLHSLISGPYRWTWWRNKKQKMKKATYSHRTKQATLMMVKWPSRDFWSISWSSVQSGDWQESIFLPHLLLLGRVLFSSYKNLNSQSYF